MNVDPRELVKLTSALHTLAEEGPVLQRMCEQISAVIPTAHHVSITLRQRRSYRSAAFTTNLARHADELQYQLNEGPCVAAADTTGEEWFRSGDVSKDPRWPRWGPAVAELGIRSVLSVQLAGGTVGGTVGGAAGGGSGGGRVPQGAVNLFSEDPGQFVDADQFDQALLWSAHAAAGLATAREIEGLHTAVGARHAIGLAQGIIMERHGVDADQAFALLTRVSSTRNTKLRDVAKSIVTTRDIPS